MFSKEEMTKWFILNTTTEMLLWANRKARRLSDRSKVRSFIRSRMVDAYAARVVHPLYNF